MNLTTVLDLMAAVLGLFSGAFFCVGVLHVKKSTLVSIATLMWGSDTIVATEFAQQRSDFIFGAVLLFLSFLVQVVSKLLPPEVSGYVVAASPLSGAVLSFGMPTIVLCASYIPWRLHRKKSVRNLMAAIEGKV
jgi:hypothetical protein